MGMVCPNCKGSATAQSDCPDCQVKRHVAPELRDITAHTPHPREKWHQTEGGRFIVGLLLALGLCNGFLQFGASFLHAMGMANSENAGHPILGLGLFLGLQILALFTSGLLTGAGQRQAFTFGATVGVVSGAIAIVAILSGVLGSVVRPYALSVMDPANQARTAVVYGLPVLHTFCVALGGLCGAAIWKPPQTVAYTAHSTISLPVTRRPAGSAPIVTWDGPIYWIRVSVGIFAAVVGAVSPRAVIDFLLEVSDGALRVTAPEQVKFLTAEIFAFSVLMGGCIAGATTANGFKQGLCVGIGSGLAMSVYFIRTSGPQFGLVLLPLLSSLLLASMGGWFGGQLLPPVYAARRRRPAWLD